MIYRVAKWEEVFETAESRRYANLRWVAMPISLNSNGYEAMLEDFESEAPAIYGAWCALVAVAASCAVRGLLCSSRGRALKLSQISRRTGFEVPLLESMIRWAAMPEIAWLEVLTEEQALAELAKKQVKTSETSAPGPHPESTQAPPSTDPGPPRADVELHNSYSYSHITKQQQQLASLPPADAAAASFDFERLDWQEVCQAAARLDRVAGGKLDAEFIWQFAWVSELIKPGFFSETATRIKANEISKPQGYIRKAIGDECTALGLSLVELLAKVPTRPRKESA